METKRCSKCGEVKAFDEFHKNKSTVSGFAYYCKKCMKAATARSWTRHGKEYAKTSAKWWEDHPERRKELAAKWRKNNLEKCKMMVNRYHANNREKVRNEHIEWHKNTINERRVVAKHYRDILSERYITALAMQEFKFSIKAIVIPQYLIELKRAQIKLNRLIKEKQK